MNQFFVVVHHGHRNASTATLNAEDRFEAAFFACCELERAQRMNLGERPYIRYDARKDTYYINGVPVQVVQKGSND